MHMLKRRRVLHEDNPYVEFYRHRYKEDVQTKGKRILESTEKYFQSIELDSYPSLYLHTLQYQRPHSGCKRPIILSATPSPSKVNLHTHSISYPLSERNRVTIKSETDPFMQAERTILCPRRTPCWETVDPKLAIQSRNWRWA